MMNQALEIMVNEHEKRITDLETSDKVYDNTKEAHCKLLDEHESRISKLEINDAVTASKLGTTNKLLLAIATMIGGGIVTLLFSLLTHGGKIIGG